MPNTENRITQFLRENPRGRLYVLTGYVSVWGLAWLHKNAKGRPVTLIIGDARSTNFKNATDGDREAALRFLSRQDVQVKNWYSKKQPGVESMAHAKAWIVDGPGKKAVLLGSANLTKQGLRHNFEMMAKAADSETPALIKALHELNRKAYTTAQERITKYLESPPTAKAAEYQYQTRPAKRGCLSALGSIMVLAATVLVLAVATASLLL